MILFVRDFVVAHCMRSTVFSVVCALASRFSGVPSIICALGSSFHVYCVSSKRFSIVCLCVCGARDFRFGRVRLSAFPTSSLSCDAGSTRSLC